MNVTNSSTLPAVNAIISLYGKLVAVTNKKTNATADDVDVNELAQAALDEIARLQGEIERLPDHCASVELKLSKVPSFYSDEWSDFNCTYCSMADGEHDKDCASKIEAAELLAKNNVEQKAKGVDDFIYHFRYEYEGARDTDSIEAFADEFVEQIRKKGE